MPEVLSISSVFLAWEWDEEVISGEEGTGESLLNDPFSEQGVA